VNFLLDNTFSPKLARGLSLLGEIEDHSFVALLDKYRGKDPGDLIWIADIATWEGHWAILSGDRRVYSNPQRRAALRSCGRTIFFMPSRYPNMTRWEQAWRLLKWFPVIAAAATRARN
jgi:hypothetical protein